MKKVFTKKAVVVSLLCALSGAAYAEGIGYTYVEGGFGKMNDEGDSKVFSGKGSYAINENMYVTGAYSSVSGDANGVDVSGSGYSASVGYHTDIAANTDVYGEAGFSSVKVDSDVGFFTQTEKVSGVELGVGVRSRLSDMFEVEGKISHFDSDTSVDVKGIYHLSDQFGVGVSINDLSDSDKAFGAFARVKSF